jgi:hypothetical protein
LAVATLFGRSACWFAKSATRRKLEAEGFPAEVSRGKWIKREVIRFMVTRSRGITYRNFIREGAANDDSKTRAEAALERLRAERKKPASQGGSGHVRKRRSAA